MLDPSENPAVPGELASPYLSAGLCGDRRSERWPGCWPLFSVVFRLFSVLEKTVKKRTVKKSIFSGNFSDYWASDVDFRPFWVQNGSAEGPPDVFFGFFFQTQFCIDFSSFSR